MGLFRKKEEVPEIPPVQNLPNLPEIETKNDSQELSPSSKSQEFPVSSPIKSELKQTGEPLIKENEVNLERPQKFPIHKEYKRQSLIPPRRESLIPLKAPSPIKQELKPKKTLEVSLEKESNPIYIRIDKFQSAQKELNNIKQKIREIDETLGKIKDIKSREEAELTKWSNEIVKIKSKLSEIDSDIFNQI